MTHHLLLNDWLLIQTLDFVFPVGFGVRQELLGGDVTVHVQFWGVPGRLSVYHTGRQNRQKASPPGMPIRHDCGRIRHSLRAQLHSLRHIEILTGSSQRG